ncbi:MAG TPA: nuclear transport factor 2 family protein [Candidatus Binataceae bacterium]|nr:nuclear transport factor 2 family protein [Candidatus Binataceae bacterium]
MDNAETLDDLKRRVALLEDREAIRDLIERYAEAADRGNDRALMIELFTIDGIWEAPGFGRFLGRDAIVGGLAEIAATRLIWTMHYMISPRIQVADDRASARVSWRVWELATVPGKHPPEPEAVWGGGTYEANFARREDRWQIADLRLKLELISSYREGWAARRLAEL